MRAISTVKRLSEGAHQECLGDARDALQQGVSASDQGDNEPGDGGVLPDNGLANLGLEGQERLLCALFRGGQGPARPPLARGGRERGRGGLCGLCWLSGRH